LHVFYCASLPIPVNTSLLFDVRRGVNMTNNLTCWHDRTLTTCELYSRVERGTEREWQTVLRLSFATGKMCVGCSQGGGQTMKTGTFFIFGSRCSVRYSLKSGKILRANNCC